MKSAQHHFALVLILLLVPSAAVLNPASMISAASHGTSAGSGRQLPAAEAHPVPFRPGSAGMLPAVGAPIPNAPPPASYDEQLGVTFTQNFSSLTYALVANAQADSNGYGPGYLVNGVSDKGYWYQVGLSYDWPYTSGGYSPGYAMNFEVFDSSGTTIFPTGGGGGLVGFSGTVSTGDNVQLQLYFSGGNVTMSAQDSTSGASASESYSAVGSAKFVGSTSGVANSNGFFTGLMTEWWRAAPYYGDEQRVTYATGSALASGWMWMDEWQPSSGTSLFNVCNDACLAPTSWSNPTQLQCFSSNGANECSDAYVFQTGSLTPVVTMTFSYAVVDGGSGFSAPVLRYYHGGQPVTATLNLYPTQYGMDPGSQWSSTASLNGSSAYERWSTVQATSGTAQSATTSQLVYYHQYNATFGATVVGGGSGYSLPQATLTSFGATSTAAPGTAWVDAGSSFSYTNPLQGSTSGERWFAGLSSSGTVGAPGAYAAVYYHQVAASVAYSLVGGGSPGAPLMTMTALGETQTGPLSGLTPGVTVSAWLDAGTRYQLSQNLPGSSGVERWTGTGASGSASAPLSISLAYYHQYLVGVSYSVAGGGSPPAPEFLYSAFGVPGQLTATNAPTSIWADAGPWAMPFLLGGSTSTERWAASGPYNGTIASDAQISIGYYHQFSVPLSFTTSDGSNAGPPSFSSSSLGALLSTPLAGSATGFWLDSGSSWRVDGLLGGSNSTARWVAGSATNGTVSSSDPHDFLYLHQYQVAILALQPGGALTSSSGWYNATETLQLGTTPAKGWRFEGWTGSGSGAYTGNDTSAALTVSSPLKENATFYPGITVTVSGGGSVDYSFGSSRGSIAGGQSETLFVPSGTNVTLTATPPDLLYSFGGWSGDFAATTPRLSAVVTGPMGTTAAFGYSYPAIALVVGGVAAAVVGGAALVIRMRRAAPVPA